MLFVNLRVCGVCRGVLARRTACRSDLRQPEVENLGVPALGDKDVRGLDVAVDDAFGVGGVERVGNFDGQSEAESSVSIGRLAMRCFSVAPSRNSIAMNGLTRRACRFRRSCRCWDG